MKSLTQMSTFCRKIPLLFLFPNLPEKLGDDMQREKGEKSLKEFFRPPALLPKPVIIKVPDLKMSKQRPDFMHCII